MPVLLDPVRGLLDTGVVLLEERLVAARLVVGEHTVQDTPLAIELELVLGGITEPDGLLSLGPLEGVD